MNAPTSSPTVSVVLSTFNGSRFVRAQLASLAAQQFRPSELIVCDDGSTDDTRDILRSFQGTAPFPVRLYLNVPRMGSRRSFEKGIRLARGEIIALCDQDDVWRSDKLAVCVQELTSSGAALVFSDAALVGRDEEPLGFSLWQAIGFSHAMSGGLRERDGAHRLLRQNVVTGCASAFWSQYRGLFVPFPAGWVHDYWIAVVLAMIGELRAISEPLLSYRQHGGNQIGVDLEALRRRAVAPWRGSVPGSPPFHESLSLGAIGDLRRHVAALPDRHCYSVLDDAAKERVAGTARYLTQHAPA